MKTLYQKSQLAFSLVCIGAYVLLFSAAQSIGPIGGIDGIAELLAGALMALALVIFLHRQGLQGRYGLCPMRASLRRLWYFLPLAGIVSVNFWFGAQWPALPEGLIFILSMLLAAFLEELIFRGFLFRTLQKELPSAAILIASLTFGLGHLINLLSGGTEGLLPGLLQAGYATAAGYMFVMLYLKGGSLLPCIAGHGLLNALQAFSARLPLPRQELVIASIGISLLSLLYALHLRRLPDQPD